MWNQAGKRYSFYEREQELELLPPGIYELKYGAFGSMYLKRKADKFEFPYKMYGMDKFPERVVKVFNNTNTNVGVMLCGLKGTGKTVQAEQICNLSNLPVILVSEDFNKGADLVSFLSIVNQECVVMIDEYEKIFGKSDNLLSIMDGVLNGSHRRLFVFTANTTFISDAMIDRPSRVRYMKQFGNLPLPVIREVVDDMLENQEHREELVEYIAMLDIITIDIVKTVVAEVNMFDEPPQNFKDILNVTIRHQLRWDVINEAGETLIRYSLCDLLDPFNSRKGYDLRFKEFGEKYTDFGEIISSNKKKGVIVTNQGTFTVKKSEGFKMETSKKVAKVMAASAALADDE